ncbi:SMP-30/gluconolactonase/LRE family protein [Mesorhizobium sp. B1-1-8]|uniref:SMP-30/gluconolactonase/LRE family protein n=1 Tax=Mesorhizobium sp. B1-1-8 TaxID=2589976 RepID=UPI0015E42CAB|nr:SMP-30/gluconolactonase/LRE family protein [Mesorhizobium sp. B1-1-8]UCI10449.1 SMP-30/gluconolactonase/LRE family protein [Mesorhizobium sp. B1-1-8]
MMPTGSSDWQICAQTHDRLGESILWHPEENALYWIDFYGPTVRRQKWGSGLVESWKIELGETIGSLVFVDNGHLLLAIDHGLHVFDPGTRSTRFFADPKNGDMNLVYNDSKVDRSGRYWIGTCDVSETHPNGVFYRLNGEGRADIADIGFVICNGPAFSPDNGTLYFSDTIGRRILSYEIGLDGSLRNRRIFFTFSIDDGMPDGLAVDSAGNVWCALYGGGKVVCLDQRGTLRKSLYLPAALVTSVCFGGPNLKTLFATTGRRTDWTSVFDPDDCGGAVFTRPVDVAGLSEPLLAL